MNSYARDLILSEDSFDKDIVHMHEENKKDKVVKFFEKVKKDENIDLPIVTTFKINGKQRLLVIKLNKLYDKNGRFSGIIAIFFDISSVVCTSIENHSEDCMQLKKIPVVSSGSVKFIDTNKIVYVKSIGNSAAIITDENEEYLTSFKISELEIKLSHSGFFRSHKSYLVNLSYLDEMITNEKRCKLRLKANKFLFTIPLSRRNKAKFNEIITGNSRF